MTGDHPAAVRDLQEALGIYRDLADRPGQARALKPLGSMRQTLGDWPGAARDFQEALGIYRDLGYRHGEVIALNDSGTLSRTRGDLSQAGHASSKP